MMEYNKIINFDKLLKVAVENSQEYSSALPYPHFIGDDLFENEVLETILDEFEQSEKEFRDFSTKYEKKLQMNQEAYFGPTTLNFVHQLNSSRFIKFLEQLTGINGLIPDPHLAGGGLHKIPKGGKLGIHVDFNRHKELNLFRRVNVLVYLNKDWKEEYEGAFELWDDRYGTNKKRVLPLFNRIAIFTTTRQSFHGHPVPLNCPEHMTRRSLAFYYYTAKEKGLQSASPHSTIFVNESGKEEELGKVSFLRQAYRDFKAKVKGVA